MNDQIMQLSIIETTSDLLALRDEWDELCIRGGSNHFFQSFSWCWHVWNSIAAVKGRMLHIVIGRQDAKLVLIWPLIIDGRKLRMLSSDTLEYRDLIVEVSPHAEYWMRMAWEFIKQTRRSDLLIAQNLRYPSNINRLLNGTPGALAAGGGWCPVIRLNQYTDWNSYAKHLPRSLISDQRRQWSRAREVLPGLSFKLIKDGEDLELTIHWILDHKLKWLREKNKNVTNFGSNEMQDFFLHISKAAKETLILAKLSDGETIISAGFGYRFKDEFLFHVFSYDKTWNKLSPSRLFLEELVRWCFDNGVNTFDFMPGDEQYKRIWATDLVRTDSYAAPLTLWGVFVLWWHRQRPKNLSAPKILGKTYNYLPGWLRQRIRSKLAQLCISELEIKPRPEMPSLAINSTAR